MRDLGPSPAAIPGAATANGAGQAQTGVGFVISYCHRDKVTGVLHGHSAEAVCWFARGPNAEKLQQHCARLCGDLNHVELPETLAWAEDLAEEVKRRTNALDVEILRPLERLYARAR